MRQIADRQKAQLTHPEASRALPVMAVNKGDEIARYRDIKKFGHK